MTTETQTETGRDRNRTQDGRQLQIKDYFIFPNIQFNQDYINIANWLWYIPFTGELIQGPSVPQRPGTIKLLDYT